LNLDPNHVNAALARAACYNFLGKFDQAIEDYDYALDKDKERRKGYFKRRKLDPSQFRGLDGSFASISSKGEYDSAESETRSKENDKNILNRKGAVFPESEDPNKYFNDTKKTFNISLTGGNTMASNSTKQDYYNGILGTTNSQLSNIKDSKLASPSKSTTLSRSSQKQSLEEAERYFILSAKTNHQ
jgi:tetratricopeptide (TPR) repeat protein